MGTVSAYYCPRHLARGVSEASRLESFVSLVGRVIGVGRHRHSRLQGSTVMKGRDKATSGSVLASGTVTHSDSRFEASQ